MTVIVQALSRLTRIDVESELFIRILVSCCIGLAVSLLAIETYGLDLKRWIFLGSQKSKARR
jgi:hypothetical protein